MKCKNCGEELEGMIKFCPRCGEKVEFKRYCKECGNELEQSAKFCYLCGTPVEEKRKNDLEKGDTTEKKIEPLKGGETIKRVSLEQQAALPEINDYHKNMESDEKKAQEEMELKNLRYKVGFKWALLIAFIAFFMPFCTVSCGQQVLLSSNGYELTGTWGMTNEQMEMLELVPEDMGNYIIVMILILMVLAVVIVNGRIIKTAQAGIAAFFLFIFSKAEEWDGIRNIGCQVEFGYGYYLALIFLILAATAFIWASPIVGKLEDFFIPNRRNMVGNVMAVHFLRKVNISLFCMLIAVIVTAAFTYRDSLGAWKEVLYHRDIPDLKDNLPSDLENGWWDDEWWDDDLAEDETEDVNFDYYYEEDSESTEEEIASNYTSNIPSSNKNMRTNSSGEYILSDSDSRYLTEADLRGLDKVALRLARNEIYARHGRIFQSDDLNSYFSSKSWYYGYLSAEEFDDSVFNVYEKANLELIQQMEK